MALNALVKSVIFATQPFRSPLLESVHRQRPDAINRRGEPARYLTDDLGREIRPGLEESALIQAAQQSYGRYSTLTIGDRDLEIAEHCPAHRGCVHRGGS